MMNTQLKYVIALAIVLIACVIPASALHLNFQNFGDTTDLVVTGGSPSWTESAVGGNNYMTIPTGAGVRMKNAQPFSYCSFWIISRGNNPPEIQLLDGSLSLMTIIDLPIGGSNTGFYEMSIIGGTPTLIRNGVVVSTYPAISVNPSYLAFAAPYAVSGYTFDNLVVGSSEPTYSIGMPETNGGGLYYFVLKKSIMNPAASGLANGNTLVVVSSNNMTTTWSKPNGNSEQLFLRHTGTGEIVGVENVSGFTGTVVWPLNEDVFNKITAQAPYGSYAAYLSGSPTTVSTPIQYISSGATITFNQDIYSTGDTALYSWNIQPDYWALRASGYTYSAKAFDVYGQSKGTQAINGQSGSSTFTFTSSDPEGVYYVALIATDPTGNEIWIAYDYATLTGYLTFTGYVNDAETAKNLTVSNVSITQGTTVYNKVTTYGNYTTAGTAFGAGQPVTFNITAPNHQRYTYTFTPLAAKTVNPMNFTLYSTSLTASGVALVGINRDENYARPLAGATVEATDVADSTSIHTVLTNNAGYYLIDNTHSGTLISGHCYRINATLTKYMQISPSAVKCVV